MSFPRYGSYRESGVEWLGNIPDHWRVAVGRRLFKQVREPALEGDVQLSATQQYGVIPQALFMERNDQKVSLALSGTGNFKRIASGDFVISLRSFQGGIEHSAYTGCVSPAYTVLRSNQPINERYWSYAFKCEPFIAALQSLTDGIRDGKTISYDSFAAIVLPDPAKEEQNAIVAFLDRETDKIDALVKEQRQLIALLKEMRQAVISRAVTKGIDPSAPMKETGIEWLGEVPAHWQVVPLSRLLDASRPLTYGIVQPGELDPNGTFMVRSQDYSFGWVRPDDVFRVSSVVEEPYRRSRIKYGDLVITIVGAGTGNVAVVPEFLDGANLSRSSARIAPDSGRVHSVFLRHSLMSSVGAIQVALGQKGSAQPVLDLETLAKFRIPIPPLDEQAEIARLLDARCLSLDMLAEEARGGATLLQERRAALISAAVCGKIDVRNAANVEQKTEAHYAA